MWFLTSHGMPDDRLDPHVEPLAPDGHLNRLKGVLHHFVRVGDVNLLKEGFG